MNEALRKFRKEHHLTQTELGDQVGVKQTTISQFEKGSRKPSLSTAKKIAAVLGINVEEIF